MGRGRKCAEFCNAWVDHADGSILILYVDDCNHSAASPGRPPYIHVFDVFVMNRLRVLNLARILGLTDELLRKRATPSSQIRYHRQENDYRCKSFINSKAISVSKKNTELFLKELINSKNIMSA